MLKENKIAVVNSVSRTNLHKHIHERAVTVATKYKSCEVELIEILEEVDRQRVYFEYGFNSLFKYATDSLKLSEEVAYIFINVCRKTREIPELKEEIKKGTITVAKAKRMTPVLNNENKGYWLEFAKNSTKRNLERQLAIAAPQTAVREKLEYVQPSLEVNEKVKILKISARVQLQVGVSEGLMIKLRHAQDLISQRRQKSVSLEETLEVMTAQYIAKEDPLEKAKRQKIRGKLPEQGPGPATKASALESTQSESASESDKLESVKSVPTPIRTHLRSAISARVRHKLWLKDEGKCTHVSVDGRRCEQKRFLQMHHIQPVSAGGSNELTNLTLLCSGHHRVVHI